MKGDFMGTKGNRSWRYVMGLVLCSSEGAELR